jgi:hypothetical protein
LDNEQGNFNVEVPRSQSGRQPATSPVRRLVEIELDARR